MATGFAATVQSGHCRRGIVHPAGCRPGLYEALCKGGVFYRDGSDSGVHGQFLEDNSAKP